MQRVLAILAAIAVLVVGAVSVFVNAYKPKLRPASTETVAATPERVARGQYLVEGVNSCFLCHAKRDLTRYGGPGKRPAGAGDCLGLDDGMPGTICAPNISSDKETGLGNWTDGEIMRAIREGISRDGHGLFPLMPYSEFKHLSDEDTRSIVAYLRTLPAVHEASGKTEVKFPVSFFVKMAPHPLEGPVPEPDRQNRVAYGKYLTRIGSCNFCHTPVDDKHIPIAGQELSGGQDFQGPWGRIFSANLTPHATGLGGRDEAAFIGLFKAFDVPPDQLPQVTPAQNTIMPWVTLAKMTDADLGAMYAYLRTLPPIDRAIVKRPAPGAAKPSVP